MKPDPRARRLSITSLYLVLFALLCLLPRQPLAQECVGRKITQATVFVPVYSHIYFGDGLRPFNLAATVSLRNVDPTHPLEIVSASYRDSNGKFVRNFTTEPLILPPLAAHSFKVKESDVEGGSGASVIIEVRSKAAILEPIAESVMIGTAHSQGISFVSRGKITVSQ